MQWLCHDDKRALTFTEIADFLLSLPPIYGDAIFVSFAFNYDVTILLQALADYLPKTAYKKVYEISKKEKLGLSREKLKIKVKGAVYVGDYAIDWMKSKRLVIKQFRDHNNPKAGFLRKIVIYDTFGFYQTSFVKVAESLQKLGIVTADEVERLAADKARRRDFDQAPLDEIKAYTALELRMLSSACVKLRDGFDWMGLRLRSWSGAGAAAAALIRAKGVPDHYAGWVRKRDALPEQMKAHASYYGGHIELLKQGVTTAGAHVYDIRSAYPSEMQELPSMRGGAFRHWTLEGRLLDWKGVGRASKISMFFIRWRLPRFLRLKETGEVRAVPFFPLPYRLPGGGILFPSEGSGWFMRDDAIAARRWLERFVALGLPGVTQNGVSTRITKLDAEAIAPFYGAHSLPREPSRHGLYLAVTEACFFDPDPSEPLPHAFIPELFAERARLKREEPGNVAEQNIKLSLNSLSGKAAQSIGGSEDNPPATANPWYAAATTAGTRRRVLEAALHAPFDVVQFSTDGIVSLALLPLDMGEDLGQWEYKRVPPGEPAVFLQSGLYAYKTDGDAAYTTKTRGMAKRYKTQVEWMLALVPGKWAEPSSPDDPDTWPTLEIMQEEFVTAGSAVASRARFGVIGRWARKPRRVDIHIPGLKRRLNPFRPELYFGTREKPARRCFELVETLPAANPIENAHLIPSKPSQPKWLETGEITFVNEFGAEVDEETGQILEHL